MRRFLHGCGSGHAIISRVWLIRDNMVNDQLTQRVAQNPRAHTNTHFLPLSHTHTVTFLVFTLHQKMTFRWINRLKCPQLEWQMTLYNNTLLKYQHTCKLPPEYPLHQFLRRICWMSPYSPWTSTPHTPHCHLPVKSAVTYFSKYTHILHTYINRLWYAESNLLLPRCFRWFSPERSELRHLWL